MVKFNKVLKAGMALNCSSVSAWNSEMQKKEPQSR
jgi:hypothetical protein